MYNRSLIKAYDLAVGGGTIDRSIVNPVFPTAKTFGDQIKSQFIPVYGSQGNHNNWLPNKTLFAIFFGIMDLIIPFHDEQRPPVIDLVNSYKAQLSKVRFNLLRHAKPHALEVYSLTKLISFIPPALEISYCSMFHRLTAPTASTSPALRSYTPTYLTSTGDCEICAKIFLSTTLQRTYSILTFIPWWKLSLRIRR